MASRTHFLLLPYVQLGHMNPMKGLASRLAALGCKVTLVKAGKDRNRSRPLKEQQLQDNEGVEVVTLMPSSQTNSSSTSEETSKLEVFQTALVEMEERMQALAAELVDSSNASDYPISCIICDLFMWKWVADLAQQKGVQAALLWVVNALSLSILFLEHKRKEAEMEELLVSRLGLPSKEDGAARYGLLGMRQSPEMRYQTQNFLENVMQGLQGAGLQILVNSSSALESSILEALAPLMAKALCGGGRNGQLPVSLIGPCLGGDDWKAGTEPASSATGASCGQLDVGEEPREVCLGWLDEHLQSKKGGSKSVLYVSLIGSEEGMQLADGQVEEIAAGVEESGCKFVWVARPDAPASSQPPKAFRERTVRSGRGMFVAWAPQSRVLQHPAVGAFLTHNGWNSTLEGLCAGVPMLCLPMVADQPLNAFLVHTHLQVGLRPHADPDGWVPRAQVESGVRALMQPGSAFSQRASQYREALLGAQLHDATRSLASFLYRVQHSQ